MKKEALNLDGLFIKKREIILHFYHLPNNIPKRDLFQNFSREMTTATISDKLPSISEELQDMTENLACLENDAKTMWKMIRNISSFALEMTRKTDDSEIEDHSNRYCKSSTNTSCMF